MYIRAIGSVWVGRNRIEFVEKGNYSDMYNKYVSGILY